MSGPADSIPPHALPANAREKPTMKHNESHKEGRRGIQFPWKLHEMLEQAEKDGQSHIVSWLPDGKAFKVHKKEEFCNIIMPVWFNSNKYKTWQRSLNLWGFESIVRGSEKGACQHKAFVRGHPDFCKSMTRIKVKGSVAESLAPRTPAKKAEVASTQPRNQNIQGLRVVETATSNNTPAISDFLRSKQAAPNDSSANALLEAELLRRLAAQLPNPLALLGLSQQHFGQSAPPPVIPQAETNLWLNSQLLNGQLGGFMLGGTTNIPMLPQNPRERLLSAISTANNALNVIRQEEADLLRRRCS